MGREPITRDRIELVLNEIGRRYRGGGRLYLVGGTQMVFMGFRSQTEDIDYVAHLEGDHQEFVSVLRSLVRELDVSIEPEGPGDFIPLPSGWEDRSRFVARHGHIDVFTFDPISTALAKIERGSSKDIDDVVALVRGEVVAMPDLSAAFAEILPRVERESLRVDLEDFQRKFEAFERILS